MTADDVHTLIDYHYWALHRMLAAVAPLSAEQFTRDMGNSFGSVRDTLAHIHAAEWIWLARWQGESPTSLPAPDRFPDLAAVQVSCRDHEAALRAFFAPLDDDALARVIQYTLINGTTSAAALWHMLQHVVNHATYHRGQVTTMLRQLGAAPPKSQDLIAFYRERSAPTA
jgi:uncharacterized damage-inducible protein DinB